METEFKPEQLVDPNIREANQILRSCVHCGLCTATCPTYVLLGDERDSPRGRIYLMKKMFEGGHDATPEVRTHIDRCLSCLSCMTTCPSGVDYMHLVDKARVHIEKTSRRPLKDRLMRKLLAAVVPYPSRFRWSVRGAKLATPFKGLISALGLKELRAMLDLAPGKLPSRRGPAHGTISPEGPRRGRVILLRGCAQTVLRPQINDAAIRLLTRNGIEVVMPKAEGCCGALVHHMGREADGMDQARQNIEA
jgi:glycolate oxidase iron-sulfur subunit